MKESTPPAFWSTRARLTHAIPMAALSVAAILCALFTVAHLGAHALQVRAESRDRAHGLAEAVSRLLEEGDRAGAATVLADLTSGTGAVLGEDGEVAFGDPTATLTNRAHRIALGPDAPEEAAQWLVAPRLARFNMALSPLLLALLCGLALGTSVASARLYALRLQSGLQRLAARIDARDAATATDPGLFEEARELDRRLADAFRASADEIAALREIAYRDAVSSLANAKQFEADVSAALAGQSIERPGAMVILDIDRFMKTSELLGLDGTNQLIRRIAKRLDGELRHLQEEPDLGLEGFTLARLQSDEFGLFLHATAGRDQISSILRILRRAFIPTFELAGRSVSLGLSGGVAVCPEDGDTYADLTRRASIALDTLRQEGHTGFKFFAPRLDRVATGRLQLESDLRAAIERREFVAFFQPKIDLRTGAVAGAEALARWMSGADRPVSPAAFIPVAEEAGLIERIGEQVLRHACTAAADWLRQGYSLPIAVNVSPRQLESDSFCDMVVEALSLSGLPPRFLELEITESMAVSDPGRVEETMQPLRGMGVRLAIDDFGTGHSNLAILSRLPFDVFKIDRQFVSALQRDRQAPAIVEMILAMAETLGLETIAEGVESVRQAEFLRQRGCTLAQGFLYSPAIDADTFLRFAADHDSRRAETGKRAAG